MALKVLSLIFALTAMSLFSAEPDVDSTSSAKTAPWVVSQDKGLSKGSFNPWKRGITLPPNAKIMVIPINDETTSKDGMIDNWQAQFLQRRLTQAEREKFDLVVLEIDSFGGQLAAGESMVKSIANSKVPVVAYVKTKAMSCGAILSVGCKAIVMEPNSEIGSAKVVFDGGDFSVAMRQKQDGYMNALMRNLCDQNGYPRALAQGMVDSRIEVLETSDSNERFMTDEEFQAASKRGITQIKKWKLKDQILALTATEAVNAGLASGIASNMDEVALGMNAPNAQIIRKEITTTETIARMFSNPLWCVALVIVGLIALFIEMKSPGHGLGYAAFAFCMGLFFWLQIFTYNAGVFELILFGLGSLLVAVELFILPTFGALGFAGLSMVIVSIILAFLPEGALSGLLGYSSKPDDAMMHQIVAGMQWASLALLSIIGFFTVVWWRGISMPGVNRMALNTVNAGSVRSDGSVLPLTNNDSGLTPAITNSGGSNYPAGLAAVVGRDGVAETTLRPAGKIRVDGATFDAVSEGGFIESGSPIRVLKTQGSALVVRKTEAKA